jgi:hypothetical protein
VWAELLHADGRTDRNGKDLSIFPGIFQTRLKTEVSLSTSRLLPAEGLFCTVFGIATGLAVCRFPSSLRHEARPGLPVVRGQQFTRSGIWNEKTYEVVYKIFRTVATIYTAVVVARSTSPNRPNCKFRVLLRLRENVRRRRPELWREQTWLLHHDSAPSHTSVLTQQFLSK